MLSSGSFKCFAYFRSDRLALGEFAQNVRKSRIRRDDKKNCLWLVFLAVLIHFSNSPFYKGLLPVNGNCELARAHRLFTDQSWLSRRIFG